MGVCPFSIVNFYDSSQYTMTLSRLLMPRSRVRRETGQEKCWAMARSTARFALPSWGASATWIETMVPRLGHAIRERLGLLLGVTRT